MSTHNTPVSRVDGNALAGMLADVLTVDATTVTVTCGFCGDAAVLAETVVEREPASAIVRCRDCTHTILTVTDLPDALVLRVGSVELRFPR
ncbi:DUF6510 family protein [Microbacterium sp. RD1]|uniref:DUF6510 family protein n=1 Tax=Microbacterium sp. RD1 TaxID=3457313 RepID=UPI003FA5F0E3